MGDLTGLLAEPLKKSSQPVLHRNGLASRIVQEFGVAQVEGQGEADELDAGDLVHAIGRVHEILGELPLMGGEGRGGRAVLGVGDVDDISVDVVTIGHLRVLLC